MDFPAREQVCFCVCVHVFAFVYVLTHRNLLASVCPFGSKSVCLCLFLAMHLNTYYVEQQFAWLHYESSVCHKSPPEHN